MAWRNVDLEGAARERCHELEALELVEGHFLFEYAAFFVVLVDVEAVALLRREVSVFLDAGSAFVAVVSDLDGLRFLESLRAQHILQHQFLRVE